MADKRAPSSEAKGGAHAASRVYWKVGLFSTAVFAAPLSTYYLSIDRLFGGNPNYAGALAALVVNVVLVAYIVAAFLEEQGDGVQGQRRDTSKEAKGE